VRSQPSSILLACAGSACNSCSRSPLTGGCLLRDIIKAYRALVARHRGEVAAQVTLALEPSERHLAAIAEALNAVTGKNVVIDAKLDPALIGGLVVKLGSRMVDSSLRTKLNMMKQAMKEVS
jgi:F-type H+-transporting ATPase subunit delta